METFRALGFLNLSRNISRFWSGRAGITRQTRWGPLFRSLLQGEDCVDDFERLRADERIEAVGTSSSLCGVGVLDILLSRSSSTPLVALTSPLGIESSLLRYEQQLADGLTPLDVSMGLRRVAESIFLVNVHL